MELRIKLDEPAFRALCRGGEVTVVGGHATGPTGAPIQMSVKMILADIGFGPMSDCVDDAISGIDHYKPVKVNCDGKELT